MTPPITAPLAFFQAKFLPPVCLLSGAVEQVQIFEIHPKQVGDRLERVPGLTVKLPMTPAAASAWHTRHTHIGFQAVVGGVLVGGLSAVIVFLCLGFSGASFNDSLDDHFTISGQIGCGVGAIAVLAIAFMLKRAKAKLERKYRFPTLTFNVATQLVTLEFPAAAAEIAGHFATAYLQWSRNRERDGAHGPSAQDISRGAQLDEQWTADMNQNWDQAKGP